MPSSTDYHIPLGIGIAEILPIGVMTGVRNGINICLRNYQRAFVICYIKMGANGTAETFTLAQSSGNAGDAAGTDEKALTNNVDNIWYSNDFTLTADGAQDTTWTELAAAKAWTCGTVQSKSKICIFDIEPEKVMDLANGFDCLTVNTAGSNSAHYGCVFAILTPRYKPPLTVTIDNPADTTPSASSSASASASAS